MFLQNANGDPDAQYFAPDYYHFNARGQAAMAIALWNGMVSYECRKYCRNSTHRGLL